MPGGPTMQGRRSKVPTVGRPRTVRLRPVGRAAPDARAFLRRELGTALDPETLESVLLVATELVTNAVPHAGTDLDLTVEVGAGSVLVRVFDCEPALPAEPKPGRDGAERTDGRGIVLVSLVASAWGTARHDGGKTVWAVIDRPAPPDA